MHILIGVPDARYKPKTYKGGVNMDEREIVILDCGIDEEEIASVCCRMTFYPFQSR